MFKDIVSSTLFCFRGCGRSVFLDGDLSIKSEITVNLSISSPLTLDWLHGLTSHQDSAPGIKNVSESRC